MPLTALDPIMALLVVDLQKGLTDHPFLQQLVGVLEKTRLLLEAFRKASLPVVWSTCLRGHRGARSRVHAAMPPLPKGGPICCRNLTKRPRTSWSPSGAGVLSQPPISKTSSELVV